MIQEERYFIATNGPIIWGKNYGFQTYTEPIPMEGYISKINVSINASFVVKPTFEYRDCQSILYDISFEIMEKVYSPDDQFLHWKVKNILSMKRQDVVLYEPDHARKKGIAHNIYVQTSLNLDNLDIKDPGIRVIVDNIRDKNDNIILDNQQHFQIEVILYSAKKEYIQPYEQDLIQYDLIDLNKETFPSHKY